MCKGENNMIYITGDTHRTYDISKLMPDSFPQQNKMTKSDYLIILGDFGCIWNGNKSDQHCLDFYESQNYTTLFIEGNHENHPLINKYPFLDWNGGKVHQISNSVFHLCRGQVFNIDSKTFFTMGGACSIDKNVRIDGITWWKQEVPSTKEINEANKNLERYDYKIDYVLTHAAPSGIVKIINPEYKIDKVEKTLNTFANKIIFKKWYFGHYHIDQMINNKYHAVYNDIILLD